MFRPAPAVLGVRVCSKTSIVVKTPDSRSARAVIRPAMAPPAISARKKSLQCLSVGGVRPRERRTPPATVARNHREDKLAARRRNPPRAHARDLSEHGGHPTISALEAWELRSHLVLTEAMDSLTESEAADLLSEGVHPFLGKQEAAGLSRRDAMAAGGQKPRANEAFVRWAVLGSNQ
jgi:hypothetical protein